ncbi:hypothetical protein ACFQ0D_36275, partial [Micromonospora zhanjiangensis]
MSAAPQRIDAAPANEKLPLKAFTVLETCEGTGGSVFARHAVTARREGSAQFGDGDFHSVTCRRAGWADRYAPDGDVPIGEMIEMGWHFECGSCGARIDTDYLAEREWRTEDVIGTQHSTAYCNAVCEARQRLHRAEAAYHEARWIRRFREFVRRRFPDAKLVPGEGIGGGARAYASKEGARWTIQEVDVRFEFPGMDIAPASLTYRRRTPDSWRPRQAFKHAKPEWSC